jgi:hypothetical protein
MALPFWSFGLADSWSDCPTTTVLAPAIVTTESDGDGVVGPALLSAPPEQAARRTATSSGDRTRIMSG